MGKKIFYFLTVILFMSFYSFGPYEFDSRSTVFAYIQALKKGDIETIKSLITEDLYEKRKVLLEQNGSYADFLRKQYQGGTFTIKQANVQEGRGVFEIEAIFPDGHTRLVLHVKKNNSGKWQIAE